MKGIVAGMLGVGLLLVVAVGCKEKSQEQVVTAPPPPPPSYPEAQVPRPEPQPLAPAAAPLEEDPEPAPGPAVDTAAGTKAKKSTAKAAPKEQYAAPKKARTYVVKKGDTLQKISQKFYGTTRNWNKIFQANRKVLKDKDLLIEGQRLVIP